MVGGSSGHQRASRAMTHGLVEQRVDRETFLLACGRDRPPLGIKLDLPLLRHYGPGGRFERAAPSASRQGQPQRKQKRAGRGEA